MDVFIQSSLELLEAFPATTVSITYANVAKKLSKKEKSALNVVRFKCYDPKLGKCLSYSTYKAKELSRLLTFMGPRGVSMKRKADEEESETKKQKTSVGVASVMSNAKFEEPVEEESKAATPAPEENDSTSQPSKKKGKKKGKKK